MHTERFTHIRGSILKEVFSKKRIIDIWRKIVRNQLRHLEIQDIYDYYDFNYNINDRAQTIRNEIINGNYKVAKPLIYKVEKKFGVCRHMVVPQPADALVIQVLTESLRHNILEKQPSKNAFYSRDRHSKKNIHGADNYGLTTVELWRNLQKKIYQFSESKKLLVITDLTNYYDSIGIDMLKNTVASLARADEVLVDLLFHIVEEISWRPDYLPYARRGLPTSALEGVRLLAHSLLFELDEVLRRKTNDCFTRWMDDITFGVDSRKEAVEVLSSVADILKSRGLALNLSKTDIYDFDKTSYNYLFETNRNLDELQNVDRGAYLEGSIGRQELIESFENFAKPSNKWFRINSRHF